MECSRSLSMERNCSLPQLGVNRSTDAVSTSSSTLQAPNEASSMLGLRRQSTTEEVHVMVPSHEEDDEDGSDEERGEESTRNAYGIDRLPSLHENDAVSFLERVDEGLDLPALIDLHDWNLSLDSEEDIGEGIVPPANQSVPSRDRHSPTHQNRRLRRFDSWAESGDREDYSEVAHSSRRLSHSSIVSSSSLLPRNMMALETSISLSPITFSFPTTMNEDGTLTAYGESLIANHGVRNMTANLASSSDGMVDGKEEGGSVQEEQSTSKKTNAPIKVPPLAPSEREKLTTALQVSAVRNASDLVGSDVLAFGRRTSPAERRRRNEARAAANALEPLGWQASKCTLRERLSFMYCNDILADVYFVVGKEEQRERIPAHKFVLSIGSVVFDAMFNGGLAPLGDPNNLNDALEIELPDVEPSAFLTLLKFLYSDDVSIGPESVMTTLYTAKKYAVPALETACVDFLKQSLGADNAFMLLTQARLFDEPQLGQLCLEIIDKHTPEALAAEGFTDIDLATLSTVLARDSLRVREMPLFQAVCRWAEEECSRIALTATPEHMRAVLGNAMHLLRFPLMTPQEFANGPAQSGLLSDTESNALFVHFHALPKNSIPFSDRPRCAIDGPEMVISRFQRIDARWGYNGMPDRIKFTVDRKIFVTGFGLHGSVNGPYEYQVTIQILHCGTGKVLAHHDTSFKCDGSTATFKVSFREAVEITNGVTYIASACIKGGDSHYGTKGLRRVVHPSGSPTFQFTYAAGNNNGTSVEDGQIPEIYFYTKAT